ncbi:hypothetical protein FRC00_006708 [Tulasnella sp. 408]|nr:hypothetical protein FRC00_006708 [Tulasnella sp. 408]
MSSQSAGNEPPTNFASSSRGPRAHSAPGSLSDSVELVKFEVLSILKDTVWPWRSTDTAHDLIRTIENASSLANIPKDNNHIQAEHRASLERFIVVMENVQSKLKGASNTYKTKKKGLRRTLEKVTEYEERSKCKPLLESCQAEVQDALASLPDQWNHEIPTGTVYLRVADAGAAC